MATAAMEAGQYSEAIALFEELGNYENSKQLILNVRYREAMAMHTAGRTADAMAALEAINSEEAASALEALRMEEAAALEASGDYAAAAQLYASIENNEEAHLHYQECQYRLAEQLYAAGDLPGAAAAFHALDGYQDAAVRSEACYNEYYGQVAQHARDLSAAQDDYGVIAALQGFEMNVLSKTYDDLPDLFAEACVSIGDQLYADGKPYEAIPYYQHAGADEKLNRRAYLILGEWESATGKKASFRADGTCDLMGEKLYFRVSNFSLYTGSSPESMTITHKISVLDEKGMSLRDQRSGQDTLYKMSRVGDFALPEMALPVQAPPEQLPETISFEPITTPEPQQNLLATEDADAANE